MGPNTRTSTTRSVSRREWRRHRRARDRRTPARLSAVRPHLAGEAVVAVQNWLALALLVAALVITVPLLGGYMAKVYDPSLGRPRGDRFFSAIERVIYRATGVNPEREQRWNVYALSLLAFSVVSLLILYAQLRLQSHLFLNPDHYGGVEP